MEVNPTPTCVLLLTFLSQFLLPCLAQSDIEGPTGTHNLFNSASVQTISGQSPVAKADYSPELSRDQPFQDHQPFPAYYGGLPYPMMQQQELINVGSQPPYTTPCATILTQNHCNLRVPDDAIHIDISERNFRFVTGLIKDQCSLTVKDWTGFYSTFAHHFSLAPPYSTTPVASVCCQCDGCNRTNIPLYDNSCAILFENSHCSYCHGFRLELANGDQIAQMNPLVDGQVSSIYVKEGCELYVFTEPEFQGLGARALGFIDILPHGWNDAISSYYCSCRSDGNSTTIAPAPPTTTLPPDTTTAATPNITKPITTVETTTQRLTTTTERVPTTTPMETTSKPTQSTTPPTQRTTHPDFIEYK